MEPLRGAQAVVELQGLLEGSLDSCLAHFTSLSQLPAPTTKEAVEERYVAACSCC